MPSIQPIILGINFFVPVGSNSNTTRYVNLNQVSEMVVDKEGTPFFYKKQTRCEDENADIGTSRLTIDELRKIDCNA